MELAHKLVSSRTGTVVLAVLAALAAGVAVLVYVDHYRSTVDAGGAPATVLVAKKPIPKGMSLAAALTGGYVETQTLRKDQLTSGAVVDPAAIRDNVATRDVLPGEQLNAADFSTSASGLATRLSGKERAVAVSLDGPHSVGGQIQQGDHVDVLVGLNVQGGLASQGQPIVKTLFQDVPVLSIKNSASGVGAQSGTSVVFRVTEEQAAKFAYAAENGRIWLVLRPRAGAPAVTPSLVTLQAMLLGTKPVLGGGK